MKEHKPIKGQCYENNFRYLLNREERGEPVRSWRIVHGVAVGQGPIGGLRFGHAWLEYKDGDLDMVYDASYGRSTPRRLYYAVGQVSKVKRYTLAGAKLQAVTTGIYGPWHPDVAAAAHAHTKKRRKRG